MVQRETWDPAEYRYRKEEYTISDLGLEKKGALKMGEKVDLIERKILSKAVRVY